MEKESLIKKSIGYEKGFHDGFIEGTLKSTEYLTRILEALPPGPIKLSQKEFMELMTEKANENKKV